MPHAQSLDGIESGAYYAHVRGKSREKHYRRKDVVFIDGIEHEQHLHYPVPEKYAPHEERAIRAYIAEQLQDAIYFNRKIEIDHIFPLSRGGQHRLHNLQALEKEENRGKNDNMTPDDYRVYTKNLFG